MKKVFTILLILILVSTLAGCKPGEVGSPGPKGSQGIQGVQGPAGEQGSQGEAGPGGASGPSGSQGEPGAQGEIGHAGPEGPRGPGGARGSTGATGAKGATGAAGSDADCDALEALIDKLEARLDALEFGPLIIDGVISDGEWGKPLCTAVGLTGAATVTVYAHATTDTLYLAFDTSDATDNRGGPGLDVLDWNVGLVGSDFAPQGYWRWVLVSKVYADGGWTQYSEIDSGYYASWGDLWAANEEDQYYFAVPEGLEMVTSFGTGHRVTEFKVPMSLMFDGTHGWNGPNAGDVLLLGGDFSGEDVDGQNHEQVWWPQGIDFGDAETYITITIQ